MFRTLFSLALAGVLAVSAAAQTELGPVVIRADLKSKAIRITGAPELAGLASAAFKTHGAFRIVASDAAYTLNFTPAGGNQVRLEITAGTPARSVLSQTVSGTSPRNALYRAADVAVQQITNLPGYFAGKIAFISERTGTREVYTSDLFFGEATQVTHDRAHALSPRWSPDGSRIIYTSFFRSGSPDIYIMAPGSGQRTPFASFKGTNSGGRFSPDGSRVAAVLSAGGNQEIFIASASGQGFRRVTNSPGVEASPCWSPDGSRLVFTSDRGGRPALYTMSAAGGAMTPLPTNISGYCAEPDWSRAKPNMIAFTCGVAGGFQIAVYDMNTRQSRIITSGGAGTDYLEPVWLADGRHILCTKRAGSSRQLVIVDSESEARNFRAAVISPASIGQVSQGNYLKR
ncbi:MAG: biopolymer transporter Tol [Opitutaceae bacterium]